MVNPKTSLQKRHCFKREIYTYFKASLRYHLVRTGGRNETGKPWQKQTGEVFTPAGERENSDGAPKDEQEGEMGERRGMSQTARSLYEPARRVELCLHCAVTWRYVGVLEALSHSLGRNENTRNPSQQECGRNGLTP